jgi:hypothetical protein
LHGLHAEFHPVAFSLLEPFRQICEIDDREDRFLAEKYNVTSCCVEVPVGTVPGASFMKGYQILEVKKAGFVAGKGRGLE